MVNLYSDTQSKPTAAMRRAMAEAAVGDEQRGQDPTVNRLCEMAAELLGKEAAVFLPSGTMCNEIAILVHCRPGDEILCDKTSHIIHAEGGGPAALAGVVMTALDGAHGIFTADQTASAIRQPNRYVPRTRLVEIEQTANLAGGTIWPLATITEVAATAHAKDLLVHMDGARLLNAVVASNVSAADFSAPCDSVWLDLSKGLGCPVGAVMAGSADFIEACWFWKQRIGGAMRQAGIIAAAGVYALEHHVERLAEDHANAKLLAERLSELPGVTVDLESVQTNMAYFDIGGTGQDAAQFQASLAERGIQVSHMGPSRLRAVTHLDVSRAEIETAATTIAELLAAYRCGDLCSKPLVKSVMVR